MVLYYPQSGISITIPEGVHSWSSYGIWFGNLGRIFTLLGSALKPREAVKMQLNMIQRSV